VTGNRDYRYLSGNQLANCDEGRSRTETLSKGQPYLFSGILQFFNRNCWSWRNSSCLYKINTSMSSSLLPTNSSRLLMLAINNAIDFARIRLRTIVELQRTIWRSLSSDILGLVAGKFWILNKNLMPTSRQRRSKVDLYRRSILRVEQ
jgi:hypothetical protein